MGKEKKITKSKHMERLELTPYWWDYNLKYSLKAVRQLLRRLNIKSPTIQQFYF